jgi:hypothetical protein
MIKNFLEVPYLIDKLNNHKEIKNNLLTLIEESDAERLIQKDDYYSDDISKLDWHKNTDNTRPWVKYFEPYFKNQISKMIYELGFTNCMPVCIWYQQYLKNSTHGWHTHSENFTGVYYLEMDETAPKTQIINSNKILNLNVKEGDFVIFPSFLAHRAPINLSKNRKTIISFNFNVNEIRKDILDNFK